jgi:hypothetical protein
VVPRRHRESSIIALLRPNLGTRLGWVVRATLRPPYDGKAAHVYTYIEKRQGGGTDLTKGRYLQTISYAKVRLNDRVVVGHTKLGKTQGIVVYCVLL